MCNKEWCHNGGHKKLNNIALMFQMSKKKEKKKKWLSFKLNWLSFVSGNK